MRLVRLHALVVQAHIGCLVVEFIACLLSAGGSNSNPATEMCRGQMKRTSDNRRGFL